MTLTLICNLAAGGKDTFPILAAALKADTFLLALGSFLGYHLEQLQNMDSWLAPLSLRKGKKEIICNYWRRNKDLIKTVATVEVVSRFEQFSGHRKSSRRDRRFLWAALPGACLQHKAQSQHADICVGSRTSRMWMRTTPCHPDTFPSGNVLPSFL